MPREKVLRGDVTAFSGAGWSPLKQARVTIAQIGKKRLILLSFSAIMLGLLEALAGFSQNKVTPIRNPLLHRRAHGGKLNQRFYVKYIA